MLWEQPQHHNHFQNSAAYKYMYRLKNKKLLLLCLNNTKYGGAWRITWICITREKVSYVCTSEKIASDDIPEKVNLKVDWERLGKCSSKF